MNFQSRTRAVRSLGPTFALVLMTILIAGCNSRTTGSTGGTQSSLGMAQLPVTAFPQGQKPSGKNTSPYKNGTYAATGEYRSPAGTEYVGVTLGLDNGIIVGASFTGQAVFGKSQVMQKAFATGYQPLVVGKSIDTLSLGVVNGSSLTPKGFMDAIAKIKAQAAL